ncbi:succinylglutamate desuccinylase/aspartoacylase family protein [uncultured Jannaschia sp.]|uniref:succinylglutamate desuccinylase/aspartoacylase family protein n=1 Tax=uncultured Jannaschia sp. TaxID=293347 RepID=UPI0026152F4E|nr:succinylglutamate desuccinylase/aspartoacylase family protein [uncultured Jannaschia sp.]
MVELPVSILSDHTPVTMAAHVVHGRADGPRVFVSGGIHGDEVIGIEIIRRLLRAPGLRRLRGTLVAVPIVNAFGFTNRSRYLPDRRDLNRSFPGSGGGSLAARLANIFLTEVVARSDLGIDLHSAAIHRTNYPQTRVSPGAPAALRLAETFGAPIVMESAIREGSLRGAARDLGIDVLLYEAGEGLRFDEFSVRSGLVGILRVLHALDMIPARGVASVRAPSQFCRSSKWLRAPSGGLFRAFRSDGASVAAGDVLGSVADPFGERELDIVAPFDGIIVGRAVMPVVNEGDSVFHLGRIGSVSQAEQAIDDHSSQIADDPMFDEDEII